MNQITQRILDSYSSASAADVKEGKNWYLNAHRIAKRLSNSYFLRSYRYAAGIIAVLSPSVRWDQNVIDAQNVCRATIPGDTPTVSTYGQFLQKAILIRDGMDPEKVISPVTGPKTYAFFKCISKPHNDKYVVIDRHALSIALGYTMSTQERGNFLKRVGSYDMIGNGYRDVAKEVNLLPLQVQAVTWTSHRKEQVA